MARTPTTSPAIPDTTREDEILIREIDEAVREDALYDFLKNHGVKVLGVILAGVAALGAWLTYDHFAQQALEKQSETLISALDAAAVRDFKTASARVAPLTAEGNSDGARAAARLIQAAAALEAKDTAKASQIYGAIAADKTSPAVMRDLATIRQVAIDYDRMKPADVIAKLSPLAEPGQPWFGSAGELVAMAQLDSGNRAAAGKLFGAIAKDTSQPDTLRTRARQMAGLLGVDAVVDVKKLLKDEGVSSDSAAAGAASPPPPAE